MKKVFYKTNTGLVIFLFLLYSFVPVCSWLANLNGYSLVLRNSVVWAATTLTIGGLTTILMFVFTGKKIYKIGGIFAGLSLLMTEIAWVVYGFIDPVAMVVVALCFAFGVMIWVRFAWPMVMKVSIAIVAVLMLPILSFFSLTSFIFDSNTALVVQSVESPDGKLYAEVVNEGKAEGTKYTLVNVYEKNSDVDFGILSFEKKPQKIHMQKGKEFVEIESEWLNENTLSINGKDYEVK